MEVVEKLLKEAREFIERRKTPQGRFEMACCLASAGNVSPISAPTKAFDFAEVEDILAGKGSHRILSGDIYEAARRADHVQFLSENAVETGNALFKQKVALCAA